VYLAEDFQLLAVKWMVGANDDDAFGHLDVGSVA
jgi:hypothetical protein